MAKQLIDIISGEIEGTVSAKKNAGPSKRRAGVFSKKIENHAASVAIHFLHYNYARIHKTLCVTPAMAAGIADHVWSTEETIRLMDAS